MKKRILYIIALLAGLLVSCTSTLDEEPGKEQDKVGISFTLSMNSVGAASRSLSADIVAQYENTIDQNQFRVLAYTTDGKAHEVVIFSIEKISEGTYEISGELKGSHAVNKVVILANCDVSFDPSTSLLSTLTYDYSGREFNPGSPESYIPMWGVKKITTPIKPGVSTNIGTINLLRAMAKIQVSLSDESVGCVLTRVAMTQYNNKGTCLPSPFEGIDETAEVTDATIPAGVVVGSDLPFYQVDETNYMLYLPEYKNRENQYPAGISVHVTDINGVDHIKTVKFGRYSSGDFANEYWDILRNHYYAFNLRMVVAADGNLNLEAKTEKYAEFELKPEYGD